MTGTAPSSARRRIREFTPNGPVIHAEGVTESDRTLCGYAEEGSAMAGAGDSGWHYVTRGKINCPQCLQIIRHCKLIQASEMQGGKFG